MANGQELQSSNNLPVQQDNSGHNRVPIIIDYEKNNVINLSEREKLVADTFIKTRNIAACRRECKKRYWKEPNFTTIKKWLERPHVEQYLTQRWRELGYTNGYTKERWKMELIQYKEGVKKANSATMFCMKLLGLALGIGKEQVNVMQANQVIQFTQGDGSL